MAHRLLWGADLYKGFKLDKNTLLGGSIDDVLPFQMLTLEEKTADWIHAVADFYETAGWSNVEKRASSIQKNYWLRQGKLDVSDYIVNPEINPFHEAVNWITPPDTKSPLQQFYPIIPNFVDVLRGEFLKRDNTWTVKVTDPFSVGQMFEEKNNEFKSILLQQGMLEHQMTLAKAGIGEEIDPEEYMVQMQQYQQQLENVELKYKSFRTAGASWAEKVLDKHETSYNLHELEPDAFDCGLTTDSEFWHLDMMDDNFKLELLNPKWVDYHKGPGKKYVSDGDYFLWFDWGSTGDIVNQFGRRMKEEDILKMKDIYIKSANMVVEDSRKNLQGSYYDLSKPWAEATDLDPKMNDALLGKELAYSFMRSPNFDHNQDVDILNPVWGRRVTGHPQMFRIMRLYWRSLRRIGWLTKVGRDGSRPMPTWVDENYKVTEEPVYDNSIIKEETKDNLVYGEHIDWTWVTEWRHVIKISPNQKHTFWLNSKDTINSIYIDGAPVKFQFKGQDNPYDSLPPVEGCIFSHINATAHSFVHRLKPHQILHNLVMNKVPRKILDDRGNKIAMDSRSLMNVTLNNKVSGMDALEAYDEMLQESSILPYSVDRESMGGMGQPALPQVLQLSTAQESLFYLEMADRIRWMAGENVGITRQRSGGQKASETAYSVQQGINYSETQTEPYYEQHANLMQRVRQRMVDAAQYYSTVNENNREYYVNSKEENVFLDIVGTENTLPHYNIFLQSRANVRAALQTISRFLMEDNTLPIKSSAKIQSLVEQSVPKILSLIQQGELELEMQEEQKRQHELQLEEERRNTILAQQQQANDFLAQQNDNKNQTQIEVAEIRAMGGMQTDVDANSVPDSQDNLQFRLKQQEINKRSQDAQSAAHLKRQSDIDNTMVQREKNQIDLQKEKIKAKAALDVAKENRTAAEMKQRAAKKKKK